MLIADMDLESRFWMAGTGFFVVATIILREWWAQVKAQRLADDLRKSFLLSNKKRDETLGDIQTTSRANHVLLNSNMESQLELNMVLTEKLAVRSGLPEDRAIADMARKRYEDHLRRQAILDETMTSEPDGAVTPKAKPPDHN